MLPTASDSGRGRREQTHSREIYLISFRSSHLGLTRFQHGAAAAAEAVAAVAASERPFLSAFLLARLSCILIDPQRFAALVADFN